MAGLDDGVMMAMAITPTEMAPLPSMSFSILFTQNSSAFVCMVVAA